MSPAAIALRDRLIALRDEQDTASPEFARLDAVATRLESARLAVEEAKEEVEDALALADEGAIGSATVGARGARGKLGARIREARLVVERTAAS